MSKRGEEGLNSKSVASFISVYASHGYQASKVSMKNLVINGVIDEIIIDERR